MEKIKFERDPSAEHLADHLVSTGQISVQMRDAAFAEKQVTGERLGKILVKSGFISQKDLIENIHRIDIDQLSNEQALVTQCPPELLMHTRTIILAETDGLLYVGTMSEEDLVHAMLKKFYNTEEIRFVPVSLEQIDDYLDKIEKIAQNEGSLVERLLRRALRDQITDVHILPRSDTYTIQFRYLGVLQLAHEGTLDEYQTLVAQIKDKSRIDIAERRIPLDGAFQVEHNGRMVDNRVATVPTVDGEKIVIRLLDPDRINPKLDLLGISDIKKWRQAVSNADGICLICGPTGSGKTTTLNGTIREMDRFGKSINTLEDPVEYRIPYVAQININHIVGLDFARGVRALMRLDPEVIVCGEIRDLETAQNAIKASETGHLVLGTLHTGSISGTIDRMKDIGANVSDLKLLLRGVLVQRLIRTFCKHCGGAKCPHCYGTGYGGRSVISEVEYFNTPEEVERMINGEVWWPSMTEDAVSKVLDGSTSAEEVFRLFGEKGRIEMEKKGIDVSGIVH